MAQNYLNILLKFYYIYRSKQNLQTTVSLFCECKSKAWLIVHIFTLLHLLTAFFTIQQNFFFYCSGIWNVVHLEKLPRIFCRISWQHFHAWLHFPDAGQEARLQFRADQQSLFEYVQDADLDPAGVVLPKDHFVGGPARPCVLFHLRGFTFRVDVVQAPEKGFFFFRLQVTDGFLILFDFLEDLRDVSDAKDLGGHWVHLCSVINRLFGGNHV